MLSFYLNLKRWFVCGFVFVSLAFGGSLQAQTVVVDGLNGGTATVPVSGASQAAPSFRTGAAATSIREIVLSFGGTAANVTLALFAADAVGKPTGSSLASQQVAAVVGLNTYGAASLGSLATFNMAPNQNYALVIRNATAGLSMRDDDAFANAAVFSNGFTRVGSGYSTSADNGATWTVTTWTPQFRLTVGAAVDTSTAPTPIPTLSEWGIVGTSLIVFGLAAIRLSRRS